MYLLWNSLWQKHLWDQTPPKLQGKKKKAVQKFRKMTPFEDIKMSNSFWHWPSVRSYFLFPVSSDSSIYNLLKIKRQGLKSRYATPPFHLLLSSECLKKVDTLVCQWLPQNPPQVPENALPTLTRETRVLIMSNSSISSSVIYQPQWGVSPTSWPDARRCSEVLPSPPALERKGVSEQSIGVTLPGCLRWVESLHGTADSYNLL